MKTIIAFAGMILTSTFSFAQDAKSIIKSSHDVVKVNSFEAISTLTITDSQGNVRTRQSSMASKTYPDQTVKRIIKFLSPAEVKGTGILIWDHEDHADDMWIYLPALRKTRRIVSSEKSKSFMGSEFSNADMTAPSMDDFSYVLNGSETVDGTDCWKIISIPVNTILEDEYGFSSTVSWIGKNDYIVRRTDYLDFDGERIKTIENRSFALLEGSNGKYMITERMATNYLNGRSSRMKMDKVQYAQTDDNYFTVAFLER